MMSEQNVKPLHGKTHGIFGGVTWKIRCMEKYMEKTCNYLIFCAIKCHIVPSGQPPSPFSPSPATDLSFS